MKTVTNKNKKNNNNKTSSYWSKNIMIRYMCFGFVYTEIKEENYRA